MLKFGRPAIGRIDADRSDKWLVLKRSPRLRNQHRSAELRAMKICKICSLPFSLLFKLYFATTTTHAPAFRRLVMRRSSSQSPHCPDSVVLILLFYLCPRLCGICVQLLSHGGSKKSWLSQITSPYRAPGAGMRSSIRRQLQGLPAEQAQHADSLALRCKHRSSSQSEYSVLPPFLSLKLKI